MKRQIVSPHFDIESTHWNNGHEVVIGLDEVGRGALAGPVVVGAVAFPHQFVEQPERAQVTGVRDSKTLSPQARAKASFKIKRYAFHWAVGVMPAEVVDRVGIIPAVKLAALSALAAIGIDNAFVLYDRSLLSRPFRQYRCAEIKDGDDNCFSIAAASIIAKVWRDNYMQRLHRDWRLRVYQWNNNVGYASIQHRQAIQAYGPSPFHRTTFIKNFTAIT